MVAKHFVCFGCLVCVKQVPC